MRYSDDDAIREIVQRGRSVRDRRMYGRMCALGGLSVGLAIALIFVLLFGRGTRIGNNGGSGDIAMVSTTQASPSEDATKVQGEDRPEVENPTMPVEFAQEPSGEPGSEDAQVPGGDIPGGTPNVGGGNALPPSMAQPGEKIWIDKSWELQAAAMSVMKLETYDAKGERICSGSGFVIYDQQYLVTACHVVVNMDHLVATMDCGRTFEVREVIAVDQEQDIAVLRITEFPEELIVPLKPVDGISMKGSRVAAIGSQFGVVNMITTGMLSGYWYNGDNDRILFTASVASGSSGGPLFDEYGFVIGVISGTYDGGQNLNLAVPIEKVYRLLESEMEVK